MKNDFVQVELTGNSIYEYVYKDDCEEMERVLSDVGSHALQTGVFNPNESSLTPDQIQMLSQSPSHHLDTYPINDHGLNGHQVNGHGFSGHGFNDRIPSEVTIVKSFPIRMKCILAKRNAGTNQNFRLLNGSKIFQILD